MGPWLRGRSIKQDVAGRFLSWAPRLLVDKSCVISPSCMWATPVKRMGHHSLDHISSYTVCQSRMEGILLAVKTEMCVLRELCG